MDKIALITGATAGIGKAAAEIFAANGYDLILTGRRRDRLNRLQAELPTEVLPLCFDVRDSEAVAQAIEGLPEKWQAIDVLLNNAGLAAGRDPIQTGNIDDWDRMIDTNVKGLLYVTRKVAPLMIKRQQGHIINLGSIAGREVYADGNVYCATKFAVNALSKGMRLDLLKDNIRVSNIEPGLVETEFSIVRYEGDEEKAAKPYQNIEPLTGQDIAEIIWFVASRPAHVCINDILITCSAQANSTVYNRT